MIRREPALKRLHSANPLPDADHVDGDELSAFVSLFEERRSQMTTPPNTKPTRSSISPAPRRSRLRPILAFGAALVLILGVIGGVVLLTEGDGTDTIGTTIATTPPTTADGVTTSPEGPAEDASEQPVAVIPEEPSNRSVVRILSDQPEAFTRLGLDPNGIPVLLTLSGSGEAESQVLRVLSCADEGCEDFTVEPIGHEFHDIGGTIGEEIVVGPSGDVYFGWAEVHRYHDGALELLPVLGNWPHTQPPEELMPHMPLPAAFDDAGHPMFVVYHGQYPATISLVACNDPLCEGFDEVDFDEATFPELFPEVIVTGDSVQIAYTTAEPTESLHSEEIGMTDRAVLHKVATITNLRDDPSVAIEMVEGTSGERLLRDDVMAYVEEISDPTDYAAFVEALQAYEAATAEGTDDSIESPTPPEILGSNVVIARCNDETCSSVERTTVATLDHGWWHRDSFELEVADDGTIYVAIAHTGGSILRARSVAPHIPERGSGSGR
jgi:hypothetical protein